MKLKNTVIYVKSSPASRRASFIPKAILGITDSKQLHIAMNEKLNEIKEDDENEEELKKPDPPVGVYVSGGEHKSLEELHSPKPIDVVKNDLSQSSADLSNLVRAFRRALNGREDLHIDFKFEKLGLSLPNGKKILDGVTGTIKSKKLTVSNGNRKNVSSYLFFRRSWVPLELVKLYL